jgi:hypothetical protein
MARQFLGERSDKLTTPVRGGRQGRHGDCVTPQSKEELVYYVIISHGIIVTIIINLLHETYARRKHK